MATDLIPDFDSSAHFMSCETDGTYWFAVRREQATLRAIDFSFAESVAFSLLRCQEQKDGRLLRGITLSGIQPIYRGSDLPMTWLSPIL